jgi:proteasome alpha subunit
VIPKAPSLIIAGVDQIGVQLYQVDPSGTFFREAGFAIGQSSYMAPEQAIQLSNKSTERKR